MSRWRLVTRATLTPAPSSSSYLVTVGPTVIPTRAVSTPCWASDSWRTLPRASTSARLTDCAPVRWRIESGGSVHRLEPSSADGTADADAADFALRGLDGGTSAKSAAASYTVGGGSGRG